MMVSYYHKDYSLNSYSSDLLFREILVKLSQYNHQYNLFVENVFHTTHASPDITYNLYVQQKLFSKLSPL